MHPIGPVYCLYILYTIDERKLGFQKHQRKSAFFDMSKTFIAWMVGWVGGLVVGDKKKASFIFLKFGYSNKKDVLIRNAA